MSKRSKLQCQAPAIRGKNVCRTHGGLSTGPKIEQGRQRCAEAKTIHGEETRAKRAERSRKSAELHQLVDLGNAYGLFNARVALRGRKPKLCTLRTGFLQLELNDGVATYPERTCPLL
jgi:hypothetical protein